MNPKLFDIHCHLNLPEFTADWQVVLDRTLAEDCWVINVGADLESSQLALEQTESRERGIWATVGFHPSETINLPAGKWQKLKALASSPKVVAIGECGLEYFERITNDELRITNEKKGEQKKIFRQHIELALELDKPLMIHCRPSEGSMDAYIEALEILAGYKKNAGDKLRGNFHFFAGDWEVAQKCLALGFTLSFTGVITFTNQYDEVIKNTPLDRLMAETDAPYVAPVPYRGKRCEPLYVAEVVKKLAELKNISYDQMAEITVENGRRVFNL
jgi:TatD DNase family protein